MAITMESLEVEIADLEVELEKVETLRLDLPYDAVTERIELRQAQRALESQLRDLRHN